MSVSNKAYQPNISMICLIALMAYYTLIFIANEMTNSAFRTYVSLILFGLFFIFAATRRWNKREINIIFKIAAIASFTFSVLFFKDHPDIMHSNAYNGFSYLSGRINVNTAAFSIVPGTLCSLALSLYSSKKTKKLVKIVYFTMFIFCMYLLLAFGARSAFFSAVAGTILISWDRTKRIKGGKKVLVAAIIILAFIFITGFAKDLTEDTHASRLFNMDSITNGTGREEKADEAWELIHEKPLLGGGFDYWVNSGCDPLGTHNTFLTVMVASGWTGGILISIFWIAVFLELAKTKSWISMALIFEAFFHTCTESSMDYYAFIPLTLAYIFSNFTTVNRIPASKVFD